MSEPTSGERDARALRVSPEHLAFVRVVLERRVPRLEVWAFGSRVADGPEEAARIRRYSDLDLAVVAEEPLSFQTLGLLREDFSESDLPWRVDVVDWAASCAAFRRIIAEKYVVLKGKRDP